MLTMPMVMLMIIVIMTLLEDAFDNLAEYEFTADSDGEDVDEEKKSLTKSPIMLLLR
jgi:hypothetical protein